VNPYKIEEDCVISFSGGRTSAYKLKMILDAFGGKLPDHIKVAYANTGREMPQTLDFVRDCQERWNVPVTWIEGRVRRGGEGENLHVYSTVIVDYETASRNGEPFAELIKAVRYAPNPVARFCTEKLKVLRIKDWANEQFGHKDWVSAVGIRADEPKRVAKMRNRDDVILPLADMGVTKRDVYSFWVAQDFDLQLPNNDGVTDWGNCDLCFLKGLGKKQSIIRERPDLADWWIEQEASLSAEVGKAAFFRADQPSYAQMKEFATGQGVLDFFEDDDTTIGDCFCGD
jgi:3'-phosphoadenosine 5'-phosphosulfate sulfotransferase (PAPS reductase)/FAD synthetase